MSTNVTEYAIVKRIRAILKLDEAGKLGKFFDVIVKDAKRAIAQLEANKKSMAMQYEMQVDKYNEEIEDASESVDAAFDNVTLEDVKTNADIENFKTTYLDRITAAEKKLERIQKQLKDYTEAYEKEVEGINKQIAKYQARVDKFVK